MWAFGITPAHAGKRPLLPAASRAQQDHPRACGEKASAPGAATPSEGSPPRMRGKGAAPALALC